MTLQNGLNTSRLRVCNIPARLFFQIERCFDPWRYQGIQMCVSLTATLWHGAQRVGTIPGAVHIFWRDHLDAQGAYRKPDEIRALYESKGVTPDKAVIPLCHGGYRSASTFIALKSLGYPRVRNYVSAWGEWGNRDDTRIVIPDR